MVSGPRQYVLPLPLPVASGRSDFVVSAANRAALEAVEQWPNWLGGMLAVIGPPGSGKTHLAGIYTGRVHASGAVAGAWPDHYALHQVVEHADRLVGRTDQEEALFHVFNRIMADGGSMLFTARTPLGSWPVRLADLRTRLNTVVTVDLLAPDDALLEAVLLKLFADRQIEEGRAVETTGWLLPRMERSLAAASAVVAEIDVRSLATRHAIGPRLAGEVLKKLEQD